MKNRKLLLTAVALSLVLALGIGGTWAYFTTYAETQGDGAIQLGYETHLTEEVGNLSKAVTITADANSEPVFVRVMVAVGEQYKANLSVSGDGWFQSGQYWYYSGVLKAAEATSTLNVKLSDIPEDDVDSVNIVVLDDATPAVYTADENGNLVASPAAADWAMKGGE